MQQRPSWAGKILQTGSEVKHSGEGYQVVRLKGSKVLLNEVDADHWKSWVHKRLETPLEKPGHLTLFQAAPETHLALARHLTAESKVEEFVAGKGIVTRWERSRRHNHWFDALYNACAAGHLCGVRLFALPKTAPPAKQPAERRTSRRKWVDRERFQRSRRF